MNRTTSAITSTIAGLSWGLGVILVLCDTFDWVQADVGLLGIVFVAAGHLAIVRADHSRMRDRERGAFELGRESIKSTR